MEKSFRIQQAIEFITVYSWALIGLTLFIAIAIAISSGQSKSEYPSARCYITPSFPCYNMYVMPNSLYGALATVIFTNDLGDSLWFPANSFSVKVNGENYSGVCYPEGLNIGKPVYCYAVLHGYYPATGTQLEPSFAVHYVICSQQSIYSSGGGDGSYDLENTFGYQKCDGKSPFSLPTYNTSGSAQVEVSPYSSLVWSFYTNKYVASNSLMSNVITVSGLVQSIAITPNSSDIFVDDVGSGFTTAISAVTNNVVNTITTGGYQQPGQPIAMSPGGTRAYVAAAYGYLGGTISVIDTGTDQVVNTISFPGRLPFSIAITPDGSKLYVTNEYGDTVSAISTVTDTVLANIPVGSDPQAIAISPDGSKVYVTNEGSGTVSVISTATETLTNTISVSGIPTSVIMNPSGSTAYVYGSGVISEINTSTETVTDSVYVGGFLDPMVIAPNGTRLYAINPYGNIDIVNTQTNAVIGSISASGPPGTDYWSAAITPDGSYLIITYGGFNGSWIGAIVGISLSNDTITYDVNVPYGVQSVAIAPDGAMAYVTASGGPTNGAVIEIPIPAIETGFG